MSVYYNEFDPFAAAWLKELMLAGQIPSGEIDTRSILEVSADDIKGFKQCHFFAGIGGWPLALKIAGWPEDKSVWTGSCPCQPFSTAGKQKGKADERHLWPIWFNLIKECKPATVFGEQVAAAITQGWLDSVYDDMESENYAIGSAILPACSIGKAHKRDRLWFVAESDSMCQSNPSKYGKMAEQLYSSVMGNTKHNGLYETTQSGSNAEIDEWSEEGPFRSKQSERAGDTCIMAYQQQQGLEGFTRYDSSEKGWQEQIRHYSETDTLEWVECPDGKIRSIKSGLRLLAHGFPNRVGALRGFGNAIVPELAAVFIKSTM